MTSPQPLLGKTILVTRAAGQSSQFAHLLQQQGASVLEMPALEIQPPSSWVALDQAIAELEEFDWLILTSTNAVDYFFQRLAAQGRSLGGVLKNGALKIAVVGQKTAARLAEQGHQPDFVPPNFVADALAAHFPEADRLAQLKILFPRVETGGREVLVKDLSTQGATVVEVAAYQSGCTQTLAPAVATALNNRAVDIITFASSKTVDCFAQLLQSANLPVDVLASVCLASIGPQTSLTCQQRFGRVDLEAKDYTLEGLTEAIVAWVQARDV
ncbi:MAG: uroporphyrinogen-III synthase [Elainella sp.]